MNNILNLVENSASQNNKLANFEQQPHAMCKVNSFIYILKIGSNSYEF